MNDGEKSKHDSRWETSKWEPRRATAFICKVCGKEATGAHIIDHIEANHLERISIPCDFCGKALGTRRALEEHKIKNHGAQM